MARYAKCDNENADKCLSLSRSISARLSLSHAYARAILCVSPQDVTRIANESGVEWYRAREAQARVTWLVMVVV